MVGVKFLSFGGVIREVRDVRGVKEVRERAEEYAPSGSEGSAAYVPSRVFRYKYCSGQSGLLPKSRGEAHKHTNTRTNGLCADVRDVHLVRPKYTQNQFCAYPIPSSSIAKSYPIPSSSIAK